MIQLKLPSPSPDKPHVHEGLNQYIFQTTWILGLLWAVMSTLLGKRCSTRSGRWRRAKPLNTLILDQLIALWNERTKYRNDGFWLQMSFMFAWQGNYLHQNEFDVLTFGISPKKLMSIFGEIPDETLAINWKHWIIIRNQYLYLLDALAWFKRLGQHLFRIYLKSNLLWADNSRQFHVLCT